MFVYNPYDTQEISIDDLIENEMHKHKEATLHSISKVVHFETEALMKILGYSFLESFPDAERLAKRLNLSQVDFFAINEDFDSFKEYYLKDLEKMNEENRASDYGIF